MRRENSGYNHSNGQKGRTGGSARQPQPPVQSRQHRQPALKPPQRYVPDISGFLRSFGLEMTLEDILQEEVQQSRQTPSDCAPESASAIFYYDEADITDKRPAAERKSANTQQNQKNTFGRQPNGGMRGCGNGSSGTRNRRVRRR